MYIYQSPDPQWSKKWLEEGQISEDGKAKPLALLRPTKKETLSDLLNQTYGISAISDVLDLRAVKISSTDCIVEAVKICFQYNNSQLQEEKFLQIHGTAMGPKKHVVMQI